MVKKLMPDMSLTGNGLRDWLMQRFSSVIIAAYFIYILLYFMMHPGIDFFTFKLLFISPWMQVFTLLAMFSLFFHAWIGVWTVVTDYVRPASLCFWIEALVILILAIYLFWGIAILWRLA